MNSDDIGKTPRQRLLLQSLFVALCACVLVSMVTPNDALQHLINEFDWSRGTAKFFRTVAPGVQIHHLLSFAAVGVAAHIAWPAWRAWHVALGLYVIAGLTELAQVWVPGRVSSVWHVLLDVVGGMAGFLLAWLATYAWGNRAFGSMGEASITQAPDAGPGRA